MTSSRTMNLVAFGVSAALVAGCAPAVVGGLDAPGTEAQVAVADEAKIELTDDNVKIELLLDDGELYKKGDHITARVYCNGTELELLDDYDWTKSSVISDGMYLITITGIGKYSGTVTKTLKLADFGYIMDKVPADSTTDEDKVGFYLNLNPSSKKGEHRYRVGLKSSDGFLYKDSYKISEKKVSATTWMVTCTITKGKCKGQKLTMFVEDSEFYDKYAWDSLYKLFGGCEYKLAYTGKKDKFGNRLSYYTLTKCKKKSGTATVKATANGTDKRFDRVKAVKAKAFKGAKVSKVKGGKWLTKIGASAFAKCPNLKSVAIKSKVLKKIGKNAFNGTPKLKTITLKTTKLTKKGVKGSLKGSSIKTIKVKVKGVSGKKGKAKKAAKKLNKKYAKKYKKYFKKGNSGKKVKVVAVVTK